MEYDPNVTKANPTVADIIVDFGESTTMHGVSRAVGSRNVGRRMFWSFLVFSSMVWAIFQLTVILREFYSYPITTTVSIEYQPQLAFPAITICNLNRIRMSKADKIMDYINILQNRSESDRDILMDTFMREFTYTEREKVGHQLEDMLMDCTFDAKPCSAKNFTFTNNVFYGNCYTFGDATYSNNNWNTSKPGPRNGLILELDIDQSEYTPLTESAGVKVLIYSESEVVFPEDGGVIVAPGYTAAIGVRQVENYLLPAPYGNCINANDVTHMNLFAVWGYRYTEGACRKSCFQAKLYEDCGCYDADMSGSLEELSRITGIKTNTSNNGSVPFCDAEIFGLCVFYMSLEFQMDRLGCTERCPPECDQISYKTIISNAAWPTDGYIETYIRKVQQSAAKRNTTYTFIGDPRQHIRKNFLKLDIFYEALNSEVLRSKPSYDWNKVISDVGGQLGLWLGFSLLTAVELLELLFNLIRYLVRKVC